MKDKKLGVIFFGNNNIVLDSLFEKTNLLAIFLNPEYNENVNKIITISKKNSIPIEQPQKNKLNKYISYIKTLNPDIIIVCGYKYILSKEIFAIPKLKTINIHPSYLPLYRGQHVINWAIINGEIETGITIHYIDEGIDTGDIILQERVPILFDDTAKTLHDKLYHESCVLLENVLDSITFGKQIQRKKQDDTKRSYYKPRKPEDGLINWDLNGIEIYNLIRALVKPWPGAFSYIKGKKIIIWGVKFKKNNFHMNCSYGEIIDVSDSTVTLFVKGGVLIIEDYSILDKTEKNKDFKISVGDKLG